MLNACIETGKTLKKPISKAHIRTEIEQQMADYVERVPAGTLKVYPLGGPPFFVQG